MNRQPRLAHKTDLPRELRQVLVKQSDDRKRAWKHVNGSRNRCFYCSRALNDNRPSRENIGRRTIDHVIPACRGGNDCPTNYVFACDQCNGMKASLTLEEFRQAIRVAAGTEVVFYGERAGKHWHAPKPLISVSARKPMITVMEMVIVERFSQYLPLDRA